MCLRRLGLLSRLEIGLGVVLLLALMSVETSSVLPLTVQACLETWAVSPSGFENADVDVVFADCCTAAAAAPAEKACREMDQDVAPRVGGSGVEAECDQVVHLAAGVGRRDLRRDLRVGEDSAVHSFVVRNLVKTAEEEDRLWSVSAERCEQLTIRVRVTFIVWGSCRDVSSEDLWMMHFDLRG